MTQNNLGIALKQAARSEGAKGAELLAQAVTAYRSALEVYTREQLPQRCVRLQAICGNGRHGNCGRGEKVSGWKVREIGVVV
jgi:hypothetical protein